MIKLHKTVQINKVHIMHALKLCAEHNISPNYLIRLVSINQN